MGDKSVDHDLRGLCIYRMSIGALNKIVTLQYSTRVADGMGGFSTTYVNAGTIFAAIWPVSANEVVQANAPTMVVSHRIRIRFRRDIKASWRIKYGEKYYGIVSIINQNMANRYLDIMAKETA